jgi:membrane-associated phospholipid phosphatase
MMGERLRSSRWGRKSMTIRATGLAVSAIAASFALAPPALAKSNDNIETAGTAVALALPVATGGITLIKDDWPGFAQFLAVTGATVGTAFLLKQVIHEDRPDHSDNKSFPSDTAALAFAPAQFLWDRYGWQYGAPAYLAAGFVGYSRVESEQHHWWDVAASAGIAFGYSKFITHVYHRQIDFQTGLYATPHAAYVSLAYRF